MFDFTSELVLDYSIVILIALGIDLLVGELPNQYHPVAWMGSFIQWMKKYRPKNQIYWLELIYGGLMILLGSLVIGLIGYMLTLILKNVSQPFQWLLSAAILKTLFSFRKLTDVGNDVYSALSSGDLDEGRRLVSWHLVSRDTSTLNESETAAAAIESLAENTSDSIVAPIFYFFLFGIPGAAIYRFVNTSDAMLGYRDEIHEWLGKIPARTDDLLNIIPARLSAITFLIVTPLISGNMIYATSIWMRDRYKTASPNAGHPMSAAAGALNIVLEKVDHYVLGEGGNQPEAKDVKRMVILTRWSIVFMGILLLVAMTIGTN